MIMKWPVITTKQVLNRKSPSKPIICFSLLLKVCSVIEKDLEGPFVNLDLLFFPGELLDISAVQARGDCLGLGNGCSDLSTNQQDFIHENCTLR